MHSPLLNRLLAQLPPADYEGLLRHLELVGLETGKVLFDTGQKDTALYFPTTCIVSAQVELASGSTTDICLLGKQGVFGIGDPQRGSLFRAIVRKPGLAYRCAHSAYLHELLRRPALVMLTLSATRTFMESMATITACRTFHSLAQQVASWLLAHGQDGPVDTIEITHAGLAGALGARRERVTLVLNDMARKGWLRLQRGQITLSGDPGLQQFACRCHAGLTLQTALPPPAPTGRTPLPRVLGTQAA